MFLHIVFALVLFTGAIYKKMPVGKPTGKKGEA